MDMPEAVSITLLTEGYMIQFRGASFAAGTPTQVNKILREIFKTVKTQRLRKPPQPPLGGGIPAAPSTLVQPTADLPPEQAQAQGVLVGGGTPPQPDLAASRKNLARLAHGRVAGELTDAEYYQYAVTWAPGLDDLEVVDTLDQAFEESSGSLQDEPPDLMPRPVPVMNGAMPRNFQIVEDIRPQDLVQDWVTEE